MKENSANKITKNLSKKKFIKNDSEDILNTHNAKQFKNRKNSKSNESLNSNSEKNSGINSSYKKENKNNLNYNLVNKEIIKSSHFNFVLSKSREKNNSKNISINKNKISKENLYTESTKNNKDSSIIKFLNTEINNKYNLDDTLNIRKSRKSLSKSKNINEIIPKQDTYNKSKSKNIPNNNSLLKFAFLAL